MKKTALMVLAVVFGMSCLVCAAPVINSATGSFNSGGTAILHGSGFGTKAKAAPLRWDDFEDATVGQTVKQASNGWWNQNTETTWKIHSSNQRTNSTRNAIAGLYRSGIIYQNNLGFAQSGKTYINLWCRFDWGTGDDSYQVKLFRAAAYCGNDAYPPHNACYAFNYASGKAHLQWINKAAPEYDMPSRNLYTVMPHPNQDMDPFWMNIGMLIDSRSTNGTISVWASDFNGGPIQQRTRTGEVRPAEANFDGLKIGEYVGSGGNGTTLYYDNIYVDNSWARVELGDKPVYAECTVREMQIPSAWSGSSVTVTMNQGTFKKDDKAYLFVVDGNNNVSAGKEVVIGGGETKVRTRAARWTNGQMDGWTNGLYDVLGRRFVGTKTQEMRTVVIRDMGGKVVRQIQ